MEYFKSLEPVYHTIHGTIYFLWNTLNHKIKSSIKHIHYLCWEKKDRINIFDLFSVLCVELIILVFYAMVVYERVKEEVSMCTNSKMHDLE